MRTLALTIAYDGTDWAGMQRQTRYPSIQGALEIALSEVLQHPVRIAAAGRTDAGVHALGQVVSLRTDNPIPTARVPRVVNRVLPSSIRVRRAGERPAKFHARLSARSRRYWYVLQITRWPDPIRGRFCWQLHEPLQVDAMRTALATVVGQHDFEAFCHGGHPTRQTVRTIQQAQLRPWGDYLIVDVQADAFLHQMMRLIVANLVAIGRRERPTDWLETLLLSHNRHLAGAGAPPGGLFLMRIGYARSDTPPINRELVGES
jgi:tRNA pseudouridine38-40 synthase